jgi:hypothetical protein
MDQWAVFTGDIVKSSDLSAEALAATFDTLSEAADAIEAWQGASARLTRFRGDGWQMIVAPALTFRAALAVRAAVRKTGKGRNTRIAVAIGEAHVTGGDLSSAHGDAFTTSGHALDEMKRRPLMIAPSAGLALRISLTLADQIIAGWTPRQAEIALLLLPPDAPTQAEVADALDMTRQAVQKQAETSGLNALIEACETLESDAADDTTQPFEVAL